MQSSYAQGRVVIIHERDHQRFWVHSRWVHTGYDNIELVFDIRDILDNESSGIDPVILAAENLLVLVEFATASGTADLEIFSIIVINDVGVKAISINTVIEEHWNDVGPLVFRAQHAASNSQEHRNSSALVVILIIPVKVNVRCLHIDDLGVHNSVGINKRGGNDSVIAESIGASTGRPGERNDKIKEHIIRVDLTIKAVREDDLPERKDAWVAVEFAVAVKIPAVLDLVSGGLLQAALEARDGVIAADGVVVVGDDVRCLRRNVPPVAHAQAEAHELVDLPFFVVFWVRCEIYAGFLQLRREFYHLRVEQYLHLVVLVYLVHWPARA